MKRLLATAVIAAAAVTFAMSAEAAPPRVGVGGDCGNYDIALVCQEGHCDPDFPCDPIFCGVWINRQCKD